MAKWLHLETFNDPELEELVRLCWQFARAIKDGKPPFWLTMLGKSGTGKSHCAKVLWRKLRPRFSWEHTLYVPRFIYWPKLLAELREHARLGLGQGNLLDMASWPLLVLDDAEATRDPTGFAAENLAMLLELRVGKWTIITSNLNLEGLSKIDDRIASRIIREPGNLVIELTTQDYGLRRKG